MPFNRPTLTELIDRVETDINSRIPDGDSRLKRSILSVLARVIAATAHGLYGFLDWISRQIIADTAESQLLDTHASWWGVNRLSATAATGSVSVTGATGAVVPRGTVLQRPDGVKFVTDAAGTLVAGTASINVTAMAQGVETNTSAGVTLTLVSPVSGIDSNATVDASGLSGGSDVESDEKLRSRLRERVHQTPHGGAAHDYIAWAKEVAGVTRAWAFSGRKGSGTVGVFFMRDNDIGSVIPDAAEVAAVQSHIDVVRPVTASVTVYAPTAVAQNIAIKIKPNDAATQAAITRALTDLFRTAAVEGGNGEGTILISHIHESVSTSSGEADHQLISPTSNITVSSGEIATLGTITYQALI